MLESRFISHSVANLSLNNIETNIWNIVGLSSAFCPLLSVIKFTLTLYNDCASTVISNNIAILDTCRYLLQWDTPELDWALEVDEEFPLSEQDPELDTTCDLCDEEDQTANHLILECPALSDIKRNDTDFWSVIMNVSPTDTVTYTKMEVLRDFVLNTNVLKSAFQITGEGIE